MRAAGLAFISRCQSATKPDPRRRRGLTKVQRLQENGRAALSASHGDGRRGQARAARARGEAPRGRCKSERPARFSLRAIDTKSSLVFRKSHETRFVSIVIDGRG